MPAEIIFSCIGDGYIATGGGFAHHSAGESNDSVNSVPLAEWGKHCSFISKNTPYHANLKRKMDSLIAESEERKQLQEDIAYYKKLGDREPELRRELDEALKQLSEVRPVWEKYKDHGIWWRRHGDKDFDAQEAFGRVERLGEDDDVQSKSHKLKHDPCNSCHSWPCVCVHWPAEENEE